MKLGFHHGLLAFVITLLGISIYAGTAGGSYPLNPDVTQDTIDKTICVSGWTTTVRPPTSFTMPIKGNLCLQQQCSHPENYELDHFVAIEIGGAPADPKNLWLQPYSPTPGAHEKDRVENYLKSEVCSHKITLAEAQKDIYNWQGIYKQLSSKFGAVDADDSNNEDD